MANKRNYEWPQASAWDGYFTQDSSGGVTERVDPNTVMDRLRADGFLAPNVVSPVDGQSLRYNAVKGEWENSPAVPRNVRAKSSGTVRIPPNTLEVFAILTGDIVFILDALALSGAAEFHWVFTMGNTVHAVTWPVGLMWLGGETPAVASDTTYEVSVCEGLAVLVAYA